MDHLLSLSPTFVHNNGHGSNEKLDGKGKAVNGHLPPYCTEGLPLPENIPLLAVDTPLNEIAAPVVVWDSMGIACYDHIDDTNSAPGSTPPPPYACYVNHKPANFSVGVEPQKSYGYSYCYI
jgi:hypothetical protein